MNKKLVYEITRSISLQEMYEKDLWVTKTNKKRKLLSGGQQDEIRKLSLKYINNFNLALDIGARYGGWTRHLGKTFSKVIAFEPREKWQILLKENVNMENIKLYPYGLGAVEETVCMRGNSIRPPVENSRNEFVNIKILDDFKLKNIDFIKIDVDGYGAEVLSGGLNTILSSKPIICIELISEKEACEQILTSIGYFCIESLFNDYIYKFGGK